MQRRRRRGYRGATVETATDLPRRSPVKRAPLWIASILGLLYAATWSGRYIHDGPILVEKLEEGAVLYIHVGYLLAANVLHRGLSLFGTVSPETTLAVLSVLSGACAFLFAALLAFEVVGDSRVACTAAGLAALSPVVWLHSGIVEIHVFSAAASSLAALLAYRSRPSAPLAATAAAGVALFGHLSSLFLVPGLLFLAFSKERPAGASPRIRSWLLASAGSAAAIAALWLFLWLVLGAQWARPSFVSRLVPRGVPPLLEHPSFLGLRMEEEFFPAWGLLPLFVPLALIHRPERTGGVAASVLCAGVPVALLAALAPPYDGMYTLVLYPFLVLAAALPLARATRGRTAVVLVAVLVGQAALAIPERVRAGDDPDRAWAERVKGEVARPALILAEGPGRARLARRVAGAEALGLGPVPPETVGLLVDSVSGPERTVYVDARLVRHQAEFPGLSGFLSRLEIERFGGGDLYRVTRVSRSPR